jgi:hypothetical protein
MLTVLYLSFHFCKKEKKEMDTVNTSDGSGMTYDTVNLSDGSGMTDMMQSAYQMEVK